MSNATQKSDTDTRFSLIELDDAPVGATVFEAKTDEPAPAADAEEPTPVRDPNAWGSPGVSKEGAERAKADEKAAVEAGFSVAPPIYEIGSLVNQWGVDNFRASREEYEAMPTTVQACEKLVDQIAAENRVDHLVPLAELRMLPDGRLSRGKGAVYPTERAISGIGAHITPGGAGYLRKCPPELRAINVNHWAETNAQKEDVRATNKAIREWEESGKRGPMPGPVMVDRAINLRTRTNHSTGRKEAFAIVSPGYTVHDIDQIAQQVMTSEAIPADARADVTYDGYKARIDVLFHSNVQPEKVVAGEIFKAGIMLKTADDGSGSIQIAAQVWRNLCLNLIIIDHAKEMVMRRSHKGSGIAEAVEAGIADAMQKVAVFADKWSEATMENVLEKYDLSDVEAVFRGLVYNRVVQAPGCNAQTMHERLIRAWQMEPGYTKTAIVNAVTRAAHENPWTKWEAVEELETTGGRLLYQPVWNVRLPEKVDVESLGY